MSASTSSTISTVLSNGLRPTLSRYICIRLRMRQYVMSAPALKLLAALVSPNLV